MATHGSPLGPFGQVALDTAGNPITFLRGSLVVELDFQARRNVLGALVGKFLAQGQPLFDVQAYVLSTDPDQTNGIAAATAAANAQGGGIVFFNGQVFNLSASQFVNSNIWWLGTGPNSIIRRTQNVSLICFAATGVHFSNLAFDGGGFGFNVLSIQSGSSNCVVDSCQFTNTGANASAVSLNNSNLNWIRFCTFSGLGAAGPDVNNGASSNFVVYNTVVNCGSATAPAIWVRQAGTNQNLVEGNVVTGAVASGMQSDQNTFNTRILNNYFNANGGTGILANGKSQVIEGNVSSNATAGDGIDLGNSSNSLINGNWCFGNGWNGIEVNAFTATSVSNIVTNNHCQQNSKQSSGTYDGIVVQSASGLNCSQHVVIGNHCFDDAGVQTQNFGVNEKNGGVGVTDLNMIAHNNCRTNLNGTVSITGPSTIAKDNEGFNPQGAANVVPGASPWAYTNADHVPEMLYLDGARGAAGTLTVVKNALTYYSIGNNEHFHLGVWLEPTDVVTVTYTAGAGDTLTVQKDRR